jgi:hypothetical protein
VIPDLACGPYPVRVYWPLCLRVGILVLGWDVGLLVYGLVPATTPIPEWLMAGMVVSVLGVVAVWEAIIWDYEAGVLWRLRPGWWLWSVGGAVLVVGVAVVTAMPRFAELADTGDVRGVAALSIFVLGLSIPVFSACHRADQDSRLQGPLGPAPLPRAVRRARERAARRR